MSILQGFHRNYIVVIVEVNGARKTDHNTVNRGADDQTIQRIYEIQQDQSLDSEVGVIFIEVVQPTGQNINQMSVVGICIDHEANPLDQTDRLTNRIKDHLRLRSAQ